MQINCSISRELTTHTRSSAGLKTMVVAVIALHVALLRNLSSIVALTAQFQNLYFAGGPVPAYAATVECTGGDNNGLTCAIKYGYAAVHDFSGGKTRVIMYVKGP